MKRSTFIEFEKLKIDLPIYFPSISSVKTNFHPIEYLKIIKSAGCTNFLISAYDIYNQSESIKREMIEILNSMKDENCNILLDSGNYESYWLKDYNWTIDKYNEILKNDFCSFCFSFDNQAIDNTDKDSVVKLIIENTNKNQIASKCVIAPVIHAKAEDLEYVCSKVTEILKPQLIAIPERLLGGGIIARVQTLKKIRIALNKLGYYTPIHLLGTGNPFSLLLFSYAGADSFDGLEWCQTCIDDKTLQVYHFQLRELFENNPFGIENYEIRTLYNNLKCYQNINKLIKESFETNSMMNLLDKHFSKEFLINIA